MLFNELNIADVVRYIPIWYDIEEPIFNLVQSASENSAGAFDSYLVYMKVRRDFKQNVSKDVLATSLTYQNRTDDEAVLELSAEFCRNKLLSGKKKKAVVAASKILWLLNRRHIIMDGYR